MEEGSAIKGSVDVLLVGGGSGGHLTPLAAVAEQIHVRDSELVVAHVGHKGDKLNAILRKSSHISKSYEVSAGKLRRYHGESWLKRFLDVRTNILNFRDMFRVAAGFVQSWILLKKIRPRGILAKGGYVGVPVCLAAKMLGVPYVTHDSDAMVSLANRIIGKNAIVHATALPAENYKRYDESKIVQVGVPVRSEFVRATAALEVAAKKEIGYKPEDRLLLVVGGGLGAQNVNNAIIAGSAEMIAHDQHLRIVHLCGEKLEKQVIKAYGQALSPRALDKVKIIGFSHELHALSAAADIVVTRAGATNMAEFAAQGKACIVVPSPQLSGGHQLRNAEVYKNEMAAIVIPEEVLESKLVSAIQRLMDSEEERRQLGDKLHELFIPEAASALADLLLKTMKDD